MKPDLENQLTELAFPIIEAGTTCRIPVMGTRTDLTLSPDTARELAELLLVTAKEMDGLSYRQWKDRRQQAFYGSYSADEFRKGKHGNKNRAGRV